MKYVIITGAAGGIGGATAGLLASEGWFVCALDSNAGGLEQLSRRLPAERSLVLKTDVRDAGQLGEAAAALGQQSGGRLDLLVNSAGITELESIGEIAPGRVREIVDVNLTGTVNAIIACLPMLEATPGARIVNVGSIAGLSGWPRAAVYSASKAAVHVLTEALACELAEAGVAVCEVVPSFVSSGRYLGGADDAAVRAALRDRGVGFSKPERVAGAILDAARGNGLHHHVGAQAVYYAWLAQLFPAVARFMSRRLAARLGQGETGAGLRIVTPAAPRETAGSGRSRRRTS